MPAQYEYLNFDLLITRAGDAYRAYVIDAPGGDADATFILPFPAAEIGRLVHSNGARRSMRPSPESADKPSSLRDLGERLYDAVFRDTMRSVLVSSQTEAEAAGRDLRIRLRFSDDAVELATLPWEILFDPQQQHFLALSESRPILRYLSLPRSRPPLVVKPPLAILAVLASPMDHAELNVEQEWQAIRNALTPLCTDGKVTLERLETPTFDALRNRLLGEPVHVLHFVGHGLFEAEQGEGLLLFEDARRRGHPVPAKSLAMLLHNHSSLRLVYLNACEGAIAGEGNVFAGVAQTLVQQGVPAAVAMQDEITDSAAVETARTFYTALATGRPVDAALTQARVALAANGNDEWAIPVLFSRSPDNRLFDVVDVLPTRDCPYPGMRPFTEEQAGRFFGRDREIEEAVNRLVQHPFLTVVGPSGSGKSSLVYAGILPALKHSHRFGDGEWDVKIMRPNDSRTGDGKAAPMQAFAQLFNYNAGEVAAQSFDSKTLLFIDQFEEVFTLTDAAEAEYFLAVLPTLIGAPNLHILLTVRADFYPEMMTMGPLWEAIKANRLELTPLGDDELWAAIVQPAAAVGVTVDEALAVALIKDAAGEAGVLPLVQETLVLLWEKVERRRLKLAAYQSMADGGRSGLQIAIDRRANNVYHNELPAEAQPIARRIFLRLIQFGAGRADTRRQQAVAELRASGDAPVIFDQTLRILTDSRLLTTSGEEENAIRRVDIAHEALIGGWSLLQRWIQEKRETESIRRRLEEKATEWLRLNQSGGLLDEYELHEAQAWLEQAVAEELGVSHHLMNLVSASRDAIESRKEAEETVRQRELETAQHLAETESSRAKAEATAAKHLRWMLLAASGVIILLVLSIGSLVMPRIQEAQAIAAAKGELIEIPSGPVLIGTDDVTAELRERPRWSTELAAFKLERYEVTNEQYRLCVEHNGCTRPIPANDFHDPQKWAHPVVNVVAVQAADYCRWIGRRLPTELEWEKAARGPSGRQWPWGVSSQRVDSLSNIRGGEIQPVTAYPDGQSLEGVYNLWGNVWEWTSSYNQSYEDYQVDYFWDGSAASIAEETLIARGNSADGDAALQVTFRNPIWVYYKSSDLGFRCVEE